MLETAASAPNLSWLDSALEQFERDNATLVGRTCALLDAVIAVPARHARMLNTLSLLEHMGSHKIMATQHSVAIDQATLKHVAEEAHHAFFMKRQAEKTAERALEFDAQDLLAPCSARMYFQRLEAATVHVLGAERSSRAAYLYMSLIVEFRALWFYGLYQTSLQRARHALSLKRVLGEERAHLLDMSDRLEADGDGTGTHAAELLSAEQILYTRLLGGLERELAALCA